MYDIDKQVTVRDIVLLHEVYSTSMHRSQDLLEVQQSHGRRI